MDKLNFIGDLDEEQSKNAVKVAQMAREAGVDPTLAVAIAYKEGSLRTDAPRGKSGEIGMMQVMPSTGMGIGYDEKKLSIPNQNIKAGLQYLKMGLQATENDPQLAAIFYNGGPGAINALKTGKEPDSRVFDYVRTLNSYGTFEDQTNPTQGEDQKNSSQREANLQLKDATIKAPEPIPAGADPADRLLAGALGTGVGILASAKQGSNAQKMADAVKLAGAEETAREAARRALVVAPPTPLGAAPAAPGAALGARPGPVPSPASPLGGLSIGIEASPQAVRIQQGTTGDLGTTGRARMTGFNTETSQTSEAQKAAYARTQALKNMGVVAQDAPEFFSKQPGMTSSPSGIILPRSEAPAPRTLGPRGPEGQIGGGRPPTPPTIPSVLAGATPGEVSLRPPPSPPMGAKVMSGLDTVTDLFKGMMKPIATAARTVGKYASGPLGGLSAGLDVAEMAHEYDKPKEERDLIKMGLKGVSAASGLASMVPGPHQLLTIPVSLGASAAQAYREDPEYFNQKMKEYTGYSP